MSILRVVGIFFKISVLNETAYRVNFFVQFLQSLFELGTALAGLAVIFAQTQSLGGWRAMDMVALVGVYMIVGGVISLVIHPSMAALIESVRDGTLDFTLSKPTDAQLLVSVQRIAIWSLIDITLGICLVAIALLQMGKSVGIVELANFCLMLIAGVSVVYCVLLIMASLSFWLVRVENLLEVFPSILEAGRWPVSLYPSWMRFALTFIVPVALATSVPVEALTGRLSPARLVETVGMAVLLFVLTRQIWKLGLRRYSGASA